MIEFSQQNEFSLAQEEAWDQWLTDCCAQEDFVIGALGYVFCDDEFLLGINREFLNHDTYTDIITFGELIGRSVHGEIYISTERVEENSREFCVDFDVELARVMVHGLLHLCGYKDAADHEKAEMRNKESFYINKFNLLTTK